ncbi:3',5'-cyclic-nucleotide phosphodiesterase [Chitinophaga agrisoli]|uniref:3',5'-cyclic-nucleotide phosphodiesterase n=1 Tax=Chitinophaga agrisoli TaxID=2607653 RepID=A0A5B2VQS1_9BACT|nr:3',5'-cyclic-nucleotide phosphodiesterase [Chitinophaga agrisoli]KAA2241385.1 3',5'-cyclic-nucleotide phosphodiesterase [Chitinophaga agrisoli]
MKRIILMILICCACVTITHAQSVFKVVPLGVKGGIDESDLSAYLAAPAGSDDYICLDAGTLHAGIQKAIDRGTFHQPAGAFLKQHVKAYFISHPHLDHVAGLIINSPEDTAKNIYGLPFCLDVILDKYFSWQSWANFGDEGETPQLKKYHYAPMTAGAVTPIDHTQMQVTAYPLSHSSPYQSTAFLVNYKDNYLLYLGDTGADAVEKSDKLQQLWQTVAPLVKAKRLKAIFIEVSFPEEQPRQQLFGHLTPSLLMQEMQVLSGLSGADAMDGLPVVITHIKPSGNNEALIRQQVTRLNNLHLRVIFPEQGKPLQF